MKFKLSIGEFLVNANTERDLEIASVSIAMVNWIKRLREDCGFVETSDGRSCKIGLKDAKGVADLLRKLARDCKFTKQTFIVDAEEYPELWPLCEQVEIMLGKSELVKPIGIKVPNAKTSEEILTRAVNQLIKNKFFQEAIDVLYILKSKAEEE